MAILLAGAAPTVAPAADLDGDGIPDAADNAPFTWNPSQIDSDADNIGDAGDNAPFFDNGDQQDDDGDGIGDVADPEPAFTNPITITIDTGGPYTIPVGGDVHLDFSGSSSTIFGSGGSPIGSLEQLTWFFDFNNNGSFVDQNPELYSPTGPNFTLSWATLVSFGISAPGEYEAATRVAGAGPFQTAGFQITVVPEPSSLLLAAVAGMAVLLRLRA